MEIESNEQAQAYISGLIKYYLGNELRAAESTVVNALQSLQSQADVKMLVEAPDVYIAAIAMSDKTFFEGRGDRTTFFKII